MATPLAVSLDEVKNNFKKYNLVKQELPPTLIKTGTTFRPQTK